MRFVLIVLVVLVLAWRWRTWREAVQSKNPADGKAMPQITDIVACHQCGVHIPAYDATVGTLGLYCSAAHRTAMER